MGSDLGKVNHPGRTPMVTILFISLSAAQHKLEGDWAEAGAEAILRRCPVCLHDSIVGHGRRRKQAHDEDHDWIGIRRGLCSVCGKTFTFLPPFSPAYSQYSLIARSQALRRYFVEGCSWEAAAPVVKDCDRVADPPRSAGGFRASIPLSRVQDSLPLCRQTVFPFLTRFWPLRL